MTNAFTGPKKEDSWLGIYWRPAAAVIYLGICVFDFVFLPLYYGATAPKLQDIVFIIKDLPPDSQSILLNLLLAPWEPLTLKGAGMFHLAFGAILGAAVWRGLGKDRLESYERQEGDIDNPDARGYR